MYVNIRIAMIVFIITNRGEVRSDADMRVRVIKSPLGFSYICTRYANTIFSRMLCLTQQRSG